MLVVIDLLLTTLRFLDLCEWFSYCVKFFGLLPMILHAVNVLFNEGVYIYTAYVVFGKADRIRGMKVQMGMVRKLWLAVIATDFVVAFPMMLVWRDNFGSFDLGLRELISTACVCLMELGFFCFVDSLNDVVQAGGNGMENIYAKEFLAAKVGEPTEVTPMLGAKEAFRPCLPGCINPALHVHHKKCPNNPANKALPGQTVPNQGMTGQVLAEQGMAGQTVPHKVKSNEVMAGQAMPN